jgi:DNA mismatch endonuclease, patch repair protein
MIQPTVPPTLETHRRMVATRARDNPRERALRTELHRRGLRFRLHRALLKENRRRTVDIVMPGMRIAIFLDGCFWHGCPKHGTAPKSNARWWSEKIRDNRTRDRDTSRRLERLGWTVLRLWEHVPLEAAADLIERATLRSRRRPRRPGSAAAVPPRSNDAPGTRTTPHREPPRPRRRTDVRTRAARLPPRRGPR